MLDGVRPNRPRHVSKHCPQLFDCVYSDLKHFEENYILIEYLNNTLISNVEIEYFLLHQNTLTSKITNSPTNFTENAEPSMTPVMVSQNHQF